MPYLSYLVTMSASPHLARLCSPDILPLERKMPETVRSARGTWIVSLCFRLSLICVRRLSRIVLGSMLLVGTMGLVSRSATTVWATCRLRVEERDTKEEI